MNYNMPPYLKKRHRRFKSIHETMHSGQNLFGQMQYQQLGKNDIPMLFELLQKSRKSIKQKHHLSKSYQKIKKLRSKPEAGIDWKNLKV